MSRLFRIIIGFYLDPFRRNTDRNPDFLQITQNKLKLELQLILSTDNWY
jgi:hypothetical protein